MSTRGFIGISRRGGKIESIYCHHDMYTEYAGFCLTHHYKDRSTVNKLMTLGDMSSLGAHPVVMSEKNKNIKLIEDSANYYFDYGCDTYRSQGETENIDSRIFENMNEYLDSCRSCWGEYAYLYKNKTWYAYSVASKLWKKYSKETNTWEICSH